MGEQSRRLVRSLGVRPRFLALLLAVLLLACRGGAPAGPGAVTGAATAPAPRPQTAPPSGAIHTVAITEAADAAITADDGGGWRLWPTLDGTRPPVVLHASAPRRVVLGRDGAGLVAGVLDDAGAIELIRMTRDGAVVGRARLPADPGFADLVAFSGGILALGRDQVVAWYDARGTLRGRLAPLLGDLLVEVTARRGRAIVGIGKPGHAVTGVRWIVAGEGGALRWGAYTHLPDPLRGLALAPDHRRIAGIRVEAGAGVGQVIGLGTPKILEDDLRAGEHDHPAAIGFPGDGPAAISGAGVIRHAPGDVTTLGPAEATSLAAFGDGLVVVGRGPALALVHRSRVRMLGYREVGVGPLSPAGRHLAMAIGDQVLWLDGGLAALRATDEPGAHARIALDDRLFVELLHDPEHPRDRPVEVAIRDAATGALNPIGTWERLHGVQLDPRSRVVAICAGGEVHRFILDAHGAAARLPSLTLGDDRTFAYPVDPRVARGAVAVAVRARRDGDRSSVVIETHRGRGIPRRTEAPGRLLGVDGTAAVWLARARTVAALRDGAPVLGAALDLAAPIEDGAVSRDGTFAAVHDGSEVIAVDAGGRVRWRREVLDVVQLAISGDGRTVAVATSGGLVALEAATGARRAWACGWHFGLHDALPDRSEARCRPD